MYGLAKVLFSNNEDRRCGWHGELSDLEESYERHSTNDKATGIISVC